MFKLNNTSDFNVWVRASYSGEDASDIFLSPTDENDWIIEGGFRSIEAMFYKGNEPADFLSHCVVTTSPNSGQTFIFNNDRQAQVKEFLLNLPGIFEKILLKF